MTNGNNRNTFLGGIAMDLIETSPHSPTDSSEDSVEVKVEAIAFRSKRKLTEPRRLHDGPLKKRACIRAEDAAPFRPWSLTPAKAASPSPEAAAGPPPRQYFRPPSPPPQAVRACIASPPAQREAVVAAAAAAAEAAAAAAAEAAASSAPALSIRIPIHPDHSASACETDAALSASAAHFPTLQQRAAKDAGAESAPPPPAYDDEALDEAPASPKDGQQQRKEQRNYKNMTRERRIEANARERTRVHTISAAFDTLRHAVPAYSHSQKLSKLSVLRIACSYIMTLSNILDESPEVSESVENVSRTIQREGKLRKKKDE